MSVTKRLRFEILRRDNHACRYCGASAPDVALVVDHVVPSALGGSDEPSNLVAACADCNSGKSATPPDARIVADVEADALRWAAAMKEAAEIGRRAIAARKESMASWRELLWDAWGYEFRGKRCTYELPPDWEESVLRFCENGITGDDFEEAIRIAMKRKTSEKFRYMCGILWKIISERQQVAMEIVRGESASDGA